MLEEREETFIDIDDDKGDDFQHWFAEMDTDGSSDCYSIGTESSESDVYSVSSLEDEDDLFLEYDTEEDLVQVVYDSNEKWYLLIRMALLCYLVVCHLSVTTAGGHR
jgi:hypothetical protein